MSSWISLATSLLPLLKQLIASDQFGSIAESAADIVKKSTGSSTPAEAEAKLKDNPELETAIRVQLAQLALDRHRADLEAEAKAATADLAHYTLQLNSTENARETLKSLVKLNAPGAWTPSILSFVVVIGFFGALVLAMTGRLGTALPAAAGAPAGDVTPLQMVDLLFGALTTAFATVLNFWFGSSFGSRRKDAAAGTADAVQQIGDLTGGPPRLPAGPDTGETSPGQPPTVSTGTSEPTVINPPDAASGATVAGIPAEAVAAAQTSQKNWDIPASVALAQFGLESAWGTRMPAGSRNPFGIKAAAGQPFVAATTTEVVHGQRIRVVAKFRKFESLSEAFDLHGRLLATSKYYADARKFRRDPKAFAQALTGTYATDPNYGQKLISIMDQKNLYQFDQKSGLVDSARAAINGMIRAA